MSSELDEIAALAADLHALLDDSGLRGVRAEPTPTADALRPAQSEAAVAAEPAHRGWADLAATARLREDGRDETLAQVRADLGDCRRCGLCSGRKQIVFGVGDPHADLVICGEGPGFHEDQQGEPFVGPAGEMLDKMLQHVLGLGRKQVYILNVVKCRPPNNRNPAPDEIAACRPYLERQLQAIQPKLMLVLGSVALQALFGDRHRITRSRGTWLEHQGVPTLPTFHPAYLLRQPQDKRHTFADLKDLRKRYDALNGKR